MAKIEIMSKTRTQRGQVCGGQATGIFAEFGATPEGKATVHLTGVYGGYHKVDITFTEGDTAVYDSYNFDYLGTIEKITQKTVKIKAQHGGRNYQLDLATFANRNYKFDLTKSNAERAAWCD